MTEISENLSRFLDKDGKLTRWPQRKHTQRDQAEVIAYLASKFEPERVYTEREVNAVLKDWHTFGDWALLRRELYERHFLDRTPDGREYRVIPAQLEK